MTNSNWTAFKEVVSSRRSVRKYKPTPIPEATMNEILDLGLLAPNSSNLQPWEFYWVRSPEKRKQLVEACMSQPAASTAAELVVAVARIDTWARQRQMMLELFAKNPQTPASAVDYYKKLVPFVYTVGPFGVLAWLKAILFFFVGFFKVVPREPNSRAGLITWAVKSTALACENLMLAFRAAGFDSCPMEGLDSSRVKKILGLPRAAIVVMTISAGERDPAGVYGDRIRFDRKLFVKEV